MSVMARNNVVVKGRGLQAIMFSHGYGCDQIMWRYVTPTFEETTPDEKCVKFSVCLYKPIQ